MLRSRIELKTEDEIRTMRRAGLAVSAGLQAMMAAAKPGVTTRQLDEIAREVLRDHGATSNFLNYGAEWDMTPFPATACTSVNDVVVHGIPSDQPLRDGDILSIDFGAVVDGWHGDAARTVFIGTPRDEDQRLSDVTREALWQGIAAAWSGKRVDDISSAIEAHADANGVTVIHEFIGHGIGSQMHMDPDVPNFSTKRRTAKLQSGMCLAIEPIFGLGAADTVTADDDWTVATVDGSRTAHWENTVAICSDGLWVLTEDDGGAAQLSSRGIPVASLAEISRKKEL